MLKGMLNQIQKNNSQLKILLVDLIIGKKTKMDGMTILVIVKCDHQILN